MDVESEVLRGEERKAAGPGTRTRLSEFISGDTRKKTWEGNVNWQKLVELFKEPEFGVVLKF